MDSNSKKDLLKTLDQSNYEKLQYQSAFSNGQSVKNGIACPMCGNELWDTNPDMTLTSIPPKKDIHCTCCDYRGYRFA